jgi:hypothetical protein
MKKRGQISVSVAGFVPKPHTPFQWEAQDGIETLREKGRWLKGRVRDKKISLRYHEPEQTFLEGVFARGDRRLGDVIERAWRLGARFDGWTETFDLSIWLRAFEECSVDPEWYNQRERSRDEGFPWDHIDVGVTREFLWRERCRSREGNPRLSWRDLLCLWMAGARMQLVRGRCRSCPELESFSLKGVLFVSYVTSSCPRYSPGLPPGRGCP